ncbi:Metallo-dependent phosphatase [Backusella circina FSU 941]|nr:Metallo-dependent phosphatase [Backusella circina FSU 941]
MIQVNNQDTKEDGTTRFVCISDTHGKIDIAVPKGDVLLHAGDLARRDSLKEYENTFKWLGSLPHKIKIITAGNHDHYLDSRFGCTRERNRILDMAEENGLIYLEHESYQLPKQYGNYKIFASPYSPMHLGGAFMLDDLEEIWSTIPNDIDILITHTPARKYQDLITRGRHVGCPHLARRIQEDIQPKVSVCGHIHEANGYCFDDNDILYINASISDHRYRPRQQPITFDL